MRHFWVNLRLNRTKIGGKCQNSNETFRVIFKQCDHRPILPVLKTLCTEKRTRNSPLGNYCTNEMEVQKGQEQIVKLFSRDFIVVGLQFYS